MARIRHLAILTEHVQRLVKFYTNFIRPQNCPRAIPTI
jgi:hypothetical protein